MKFSYLVIIVFVIILGFGGYLLFFRPKNINTTNVGATENQTQPSALIPINATTIPKTEKIALGSRHGTVIVNNFYKVAQGYDGEALIIRGTPEYQIIYDGVYSAFGIHIIGGVVESSRKAAEDELVNILKISHEQACYLNVSWSVSPSVDRGLSGRNYPLSFCAAGV